MRRQLQNDLFTAWQKSIKRDYRNQRINSERSLQASLWSQLNLILAPKTWRVFIEPPLRVKAECCFPDFIICNTVKVIAVVELKYQPRVLPNYVKDMETLRQLAKHRNNLVLEDSRLRGKGLDEKRYPFSDSVLFVWAGIHRKPIDSYESSDIPLLSSGINELDGCFMQLHAETGLDEHPNVFRRFG